MTTDEQGRIDDAESRAALLEHLRRPDAHPSEAVEARLIEAMGAVRNRWIEQEAARGTLSEHFSDAVISEVARSLTAAMLAYYDAGYAPRGLYIEYCRQVAEALYNRLVARYDGAHHTLAYFLAAGKQK